MALNIRIYIFLAVTLLLGSTVFSIPDAIAERGLSFLCKKGPCVDALKNEEMTPFSPLECEEEAFVLIIAPSEDQKVVFDSNEPGTLRIQAHAWAVPQELKGDIEWEMESIGEISPEITPAFGPKVEIVFRGLPVGNEGFGSKKITAKLTYECAAPVTLTDQISVEVFFDPVARNNPGGMMPNWAYYWKQTSAGQGIDFTYLPQPVCAPGPPPPLGRYDYDADRIEIYDALMGHKCRERPDGSAAEFIDCFAETLRHEQQHQVELRSWWAGHPTGPPNACGSIARGVRAMGFDTDLDMVPNHIEQALPGCNPLKKRSCPGLPSFKDVTDVEMNAYRVGWGWRIGAADNEDWSAAGKQWR